MFPYDPELLAAVRAVPDTLAGVLQILRAADALLPPGDGLKWFHQLYLQVTEAVAQRVDAGDFSHPEWMAALDVQFARLYLAALTQSLQGTDPPQGQAPECWQVMFDRRADTRLARIQFALAGMNAHINHDLPSAIVNTCRATGTAPDRGPLYADFTALDTTLAALVDQAKAELHVRLLGGALPPVSHLEDTLAAFSVTAAREYAWTGSEILWVPMLSAGYLRTLEGWPAALGKTLLVAVP
jgi:hypothetical protein